MNCLLDTHTFLWAVFAPEKLSRKAKAAIRSPENQICVSTISFWEISLKFALSKIDLENCSPDDLPGIAEKMRLDIVSPTADETASFHRLPKLHHKDPFDRMIIWQAIRYPLVLISKDSGFSEHRKYGLEVLW